MSQPLEVGEKNLNLMEIGTDISEKEEKNEYEKEKVEEMDYETIRRSSERGKRKRGEQ